MYFSISQTELLRAVTVVQKGVSTRSTLPVLSGILINARNDKVVFQSTDLELSIQYETSALIEEEGDAVVPAHLFGEIVKNLPDRAVTVSAKDTEIVITCETSSFSIKGLAPQDFPAFPQVTSENSVTIPFETFSSMAKKVYRVVSKDESRPILTGVLILLEEDSLKMVATDSYRLSVVENKVEQAPNPFEVVIAGSFLAELSSLPAGMGDIVIGIAENQIIVNYGDMKFVNRRLEGKFPNYRQLLPSSYETRAVFDVKELMNSVKRASLLDKSGSPIKINLNGASNTVQISSVTRDVGSAQETISAEITGPDTEIGFNSYYVSEGLSAFQADKVALELQGGMKPGIFKSTAEDEHYLYLVMPVRL